MKHIVVMVGNYPPNVKDLSRRWKAMYHLLLASAGAVIEYRKLTLSGMIGIVSDSYSIEALVDNEAYQEAIKMQIYSITSVSMMFLLQESIRMHLSQN